MRARRRGVLGAVLGMGVAAVVMVGAGGTARPASAASGNSGAPSGNSGAPAGNSGSGGASGSTIESYLLGASAPVAQVTEDEPSANFHPEGEGEYNYTLATLDPSRGYGLSAVFWPGGAAANAGALIVLLGGPSQASAISDPVRAEASTGTSTTQQSTTLPNGTVMSAKASSQGSSAQGQTAGGGLGPAGSIGQSTSSSTVTITNSTNTITSLANTNAQNITVGGVIKIGQVTSSAKA
ncbi:MAG TPA: hypothetical protein VGR90_05925, partial [Acidimicrobiales bacterium]|nr:hypothetical protein [Acidimicrobiales bacterium]